MLNPRNSPGHPGDTRVGIPLYPLRHPAVQGQAQAVPLPRVRSRGQTCLTDRFWASLEREHIARREARPGCTSGAAHQKPGTYVTVLLPRRSTRPLLGRLLHGRTAGKIAGVVSQIPRPEAMIIPFDVTARVEMLHEHQPGPTEGEARPGELPVQNSAGRGCLRIPPDGERCAVECITVERIASPLPGGPAPVLLCERLHHDWCLGSAEGRAHDVGEFVAAGAWCGGWAPAVRVERVCAGFDGTQR